MDKLNNTKMINDTVFKCLLLIFVTTFVSCNHDAPTPPSSQNSQNTQSTNSNVQEVAMQNTSFVPAELTVAPGTTVRWVNKDAIPHTATSDQNLFDSGNMPPNATYEYTFNTPGTFNYHCQYHAPHMVGKIIVQP